MAHRSDPTFHTLHAVRLRGRASTESVGHSLGVGADVDELLQQASEAGYMTYREGRAAGWSLTPEGREAHAELVAAERAACGAEPIIRDAYAQFLAINHDLIQICTNWQLAPDGAPNDHTDAAYDATVIGSLAAIDTAAQPICAQLADAMARFATYGPRLAAAVAKVSAGETSFFASPRVDSYHTIWFELHEDLLQTLGIPRGDGT